MQVKGNGAREERLADWFSTVVKRPGGDILVVQTLRNGLMAAGVLASAALVGLMGNLATAQAQGRAMAGVVSCGLALSAACARYALVRLSQLSYEFQLGEIFKRHPAKTLITANRATQTSATLLAIALAAAAIGQMWRIA